MKTSLQIKVLLLALACAGQAADQTAVPVEEQQKPGFAMTIRPEQPTLKPGCKVVALVTLTNTSGKEMQLGFTGKYHHSPQPGRSRRDGRDGEF
jgi:hypothetical protein